MRLRIALRWPSHSVSHASYPLPVLWMGCQNELNFIVVGALDLLRAVWDFLGISSRLNVEISAGGMVEDANIVYKYSHSIL